jgi:riboflavin synthase
VFTGIVEATGLLASRQPRGPGFRIRVRAKLGTLVLGESIAVSGACLTVVSASDEGFDADISSETAERTTLGRAPVGARVNLERSLRVGDRMGGHIVTGHVDGIARVERSVPLGEARRVDLSVPAALLRWIAPKGSVTLDGVSLTVNQVSAGGFDVMLIPHTLAVTTLGELAAGSELNLEVDLVARYVARWLEGGEGAGAVTPGESLQARLERAGFVR